MKVTVEARYYPNLVAHALAVMGLANSIDTYSPEMPALRERFGTVTKDRKAGITRCPPSPAL